MSGAEPCTGSNIEGARALGVDVGRGGEAEAALDRRAEVGQDVAEEVGGDHDVEALGRHHHAGAHRVDMVAA